MARITTGDGRDLVISRRYRGRRIVPARDPFTLTFDLTQPGKDRLAATGRGKAYVVVTAANRTGASRSVRRAISTG